MEQWGLAPGWWTLRGIPSAVPKEHAASRQKGGPMAEAPVKQAPIPNSSTAAMLLELRAIRQTLDEIKELVVTRAAPVTNDSVDGVALVIAMDEPVVQSLPPVAAALARSKDKKGNKERKARKKG
jgi:hypothetical protein